MRATSRDPAGSARTGGADIRGKGREAIRMDDLLFLTACPNCDGRLLLVSLRRTSCDGGACILRTTLEARGGIPLSDLQHDAPRARILTTIPSSLFSFTPTGSLSAPPPNAGLHSTTLSVVLVQADGSASWPPPGAGRVEVSIVQVAVRRRWDARQGPGLMRSRRQ